METFKTISKFKRGIFNKLFINLKPNSTHLLNVKHNILIFQALNSIKFLTVPAGEILFLKGDNIHKTAYFIVKGSIAICKGVNESEDYRNLRDYQGFKKNTPGKPYFIEDAMKGKNNEWNNAEFYFTDIQNTSKDKEYDIRKSLIKQQITSDRRGGIIETSSGDIDINTLKNKGKKNNRSFIDEWSLEDQNFRGDSHFKMRKISIGDNDDSLKIGSKKRGAANPQISRNDLAEFLQQDNKNKEKDNENSVIEDDRNLDESIIEENELKFIESDSLEDKFGKLLKIMTKGDFFGELVLTSAESRTASAIVQQTSEVLIIDSFIYRKFFRTDSIEQEREKLRLVQIHFPLVKEMPKETQLTFIYSIRELKLQRGKSIVCEGELIKEFYVVTKGSVSISKTIDFQKFEQQIQKHRQMKREVSNKQKKMEVESILEGIKKLPKHLWKLFDKLEVPIAIAGTSEFIGDEVLYPRLKRYLFTIKCDTDCTFLCLNRTSANNSMPSYYKNLIKVQFREKLKFRFGRFTKFIKSECDKAIDNENQGISLISKKMNPLFIPFIKSTEIKNFQHSITLEQYQRLKSEFVKKCKNIGQSQESFSKYQYLKSKNKFIGRTNKTRLLLRVKNERLNFMNSELNINKSKKTRLKIKETFGMIQMLKQRTEREKKDMESEKKALYFSMRQNLKLMGSKILLLLPSTFVYLAQFY